VPSKRTYGDSCGIARALDLVGERWALLVVRELVLGPKRFTDLRGGLLNLSPDVLAQRLRDLEEAGIVRRRTLPPPTRARVYELTEWGHELEPVLLALGRWGSRAPFPPGEAELGVDALILALQTTFDPAEADRQAATYELRLAGQTFTARVVEGRLELTRATPEDPDAVIESDPATLTAVLWHGRWRAEAERDGDMTIGGSRAAAGRFLKLFPAPTPVAESRLLHVRGRAASRALGQ
jgi:DNA-binding HxlR family transcriptional regulator